MEKFRWVLSALLCLLTCDIALAQCPSVNSQCSCLEQESVIGVYQCDNLGEIAGLPDLGETDDIIQVIQISSSIVRNIYNNSFPGLKTRTLDMRTIGIQRLEVKAFAGLENYIENLYLAGNEIQVVPVGIFKDLIHLRTLTLDRNSITVIDSDQFKGLQSLTHLGLEGNNIASLSDGAFYGMPNVKYLYLQRNIIQQMPPGIFDELVNIRELNLVGNRISSLSPDVFSKMPLMEELHISINRLQNLPEVIFDNNKNLKIIDLNDNRISSNLTNRHFNGPRNVELLDFSFNNLTYFHPSTFHNLKKLRKLDLDNNKFNKLASSAFEGLDNIEELYLHQNLIKELPTNSFIGMPNLQLLDLSRNQIQKLRFGIFDPFGHLRTLDISHNEIGNIDHGPFITLRSLEVLDVSWNRVPIVNRDWFAQDDWETAAKPLKELYLQNNAIKHIDKEAFWPLKNLEKLDISTNRIFNLNETVFKELSALKEISIHSNPLHNISKGLFSSLDQIKVLDVSQTCLTEIVPFTFDGMAALEKLDLSGGFIRTIYPESFNGSGSISILNISHNNITTLEHSVFTHLSDSLEVLQLDHNALTIEGLGDNLDLVNTLRILDLSYNNLQNIRGEANLRQKGVLLRIMANPIICDCSTSWFANFETLADFQEVLCESPSHLNGQAAVCFEFPPECSQMPVAQMYVTYCANRPDTVHQQNDNTSDSNSTGIEENKTLIVKGIDDYIAYCIEPEIPSTTPKPDDGRDEDLEPLPDPLSIDTVVEDIANVFVMWQYQNNSRILGYKLTYREFGEDNAEVEKMILNLKRTNYTFNNLNLGSNYIICVGIILDDDSILTDSKSCREVAILIDATRPPIEVITSANNLDEGFPIVPVIGTCVAVVITLVIILVIVIVCLKRKPKKEEDKYMDDRLRDKMGMWVNSFNYSGGVNEQIAEQTTVEVDIFAPIDVAKKKKEGRKSNGHVTS